MTEYGEVVITKSYAIVERADPLALLSLELLRQCRDDVWTNADHLYLGNTRSGQEVIYRIVGWDADRRALTVRRVCCDMHNAHCEPPADLCCQGCTEVTPH